MELTVSARAIRLSAAVFLVGAVLYAIGAIATIPAGGVGSTPRTLWILVHAVLLLGSVALLLGLPGLYLSQAREIGAIGLLGGILVFVGFLGIGFFTAAAQTVLLPWVYDKASCTLGCHLLSTADGPPLYAWFFVIAALATFVGLALFGVSIARARISVGPGYLMALAGILALPTIFVSLAAAVALIPVLLALVAVTIFAVQLLTSDSQS